MDSDTFGNIAHFNELLELIIELKLTSDTEFVFWAEIIPNPHFTSELFERMVIAGFKNIFIGYDGLSDSTLKKMNKSNSFSDNLFFVKQSILKGIDPYVNVIKHIPQAPEEDVQECIDNLHYTRFFYHDPIVSFSHNYVNLVMSSMSKYFKSSSETERKAYDYDIMTYLVPETFKSDENRFHLFRYERNIQANAKEWDKLIAIENYYKENTLRYKTHQHNGVLYYTEYCNDEEICNLIFSRPEYLILLQYIETQVRTFTEVLTLLTKTLPDFTAEDLINALHYLKQEHLIYCDHNYSNVVSLITVEGGCER